MKRIFSFKGVKNSLLTPSKAFILLTIFTYSLCGFSQNDNYISLQKTNIEVPNVIPPSPSVANLVSVGEVPVNLYTGQPGIQLPLYAKTLPYGLEIGYTLSYNTNELKVDSKSSWIGNGWSLSGEAFVSRTVMGVRDEAQKGDEQPGDDVQSGILFNGFLDIDFENFNSFNSYDDTLYNFVWNASGKGSGSYNDTSSQNNGNFDSEFDMFTVTLFGASAKFILNRDTNGTIVANMLENESNLKVNVQSTSTNVLNGFEVIDTNGLRYYMTVPEVTHSQTGAATTLQADQQTSLSISKSDHVATWKIATVVSPIGQTLATFFYNEVSETITMPISVTENHITQYIYPHQDYVLDQWLEHDSGAQPGLKEYNNSVAKPKQVITHNTMTMETQKIARVEFYDNAKIEFILSATSHPEYDSGGSWLQNIRITKPDNTLLKTVQLSQVTTQNNRLFLTGLTEQYPNATEALSYTLTYNDAELLPTSTTSNTKKDIWDYYKGNNNPTPYSSIYDDPKIANTATVTTGAIASITFPTGGKQVFNFESNTFAHTGGAPLSINEIKQLNSNNWSIANASAWYTTTSGTPSYTDSNTFTITEEHTVELEPKLHLGSNSNQSVATYLENLGLQLMRVESDNSETQIDVFQLKKRRQIVLPQGTYRLRFLSPNTTGGSPPYFDLECILHYKDFVANPENYVYGGGIRIKNIELRNSDNVIETQTNYHYDFEESTQGNPISSSGVIDGFFTNVRDHRKVYNHIFFYVPSTSDNTIYISPVEIPVEYKIKEYLNSAYISSGSGSSVGYAKVTQSKQENGKTVTEFTSPIDINFNTYGTSYGWPFLPKRDKSYLQGKQLKQTIYDNDNRILSESSTTYQNFETQKAIYTFIYGNDCSWNQFYGTYSALLATFPNQDRIPLGYADSDFFDICRQPNNPAPFVFYLNKIKLYDARYLPIENRTTSYKYQGNTPLITEQKQTFSYNNLYQISQQTAYEHVDESGDYYVTKNYYPLDNNIPASYQGSSASINNLIAHNKINAPLVSENYKKEQMMAQTHTIYNTFNNNIIPQYVQTAKGTNTLESRVVYHNYDSYGNPTEVSQEGGTRISYLWNDNGQYPIAKIENATYAQVQNALGSSVTINNGLSISQENNLRTTLANAQITTYTYEPLVGITSVTDPRGYRMTYHYDNLNRLQYVKDQDGNILSENKYNYKN